MFEIVLGRTQLVGSKFSIFGVEGSEGFEVWFFWIWAWIQPIFGKTGSRFGLFGGDQKGSKFSFGGQTWVCVSLKFDLSSSKQIEVHES